jgi:hypothetical protein
MPVRVAEHESVSQRVILVESSECDENCCCCRISSQTRKFPKSKRTNDRISGRCHDQNVNNEGNVAQDQEREGGLGNQDQDDGPSRTVIVDAVVGLPSDGDSWLRSVPGAVSC